MTTSPNPRPRLGRPPATGEARTVELRVRLSPSERARVAEDAAAAGCGVSEYVRRVVLGCRIGA